MNTKPLETFAQDARRDLLAQVATRLDYVLRADNVELRARSATIEQLEQAIHTHGREIVIDRVAYTWFNRFCALRFMDANRYTSPAVVSPAPGATQPEILQEAKQGHVDERLTVDQQRVLDLLAGRVPSRDGQGEAYRLLLVAACNQWHRAMPFLFEPIDDYTELLLPDDLLSANSVLAATRETLTEAVCEDVEVIGWLYQFYISERKDEVIGSKQKIGAADIPAATQLFTPHWIVRYLVENSLGRLWLLNHPDSKLAERMEYYIAPQDEKPGFLEKPGFYDDGFLRVASPEELRLCDPAAGSGHMLTYAFDLLYAIYEEAGYAPADIPRLILTRNLTGIEIDERAADLAAFALMMKARSKDRRFFSRDVRPRIVVVRPPGIDRAQLEQAGWFRELGRTLLDKPAKDALLTDLHWLEQADNLGSLIRPELSAGQIAALRERIGAADDLLSHTLNRQVLEALEMPDALAGGYHVVVANPPYMGGGNMNGDLKKFAKYQYPDSKADLFAMFIERCLALAEQGGLVGMITMQSWMFLSSYEKLREKLLAEDTILTMAHYGPRAFDTISGEVVSTTAFVLAQAHRPEHQGDFLRLIDGRNEAEKSAMTLEAIADPDCDWFYRAAAADFRKIPGSPIAYWVSAEVREVYDAPLIGKTYSAKEGVGTRNDEQFMRMCWEVSVTNIARDRRWILTDKAGDFRRWFMGFTYVMDWENDGHRIKNYRNPDGSLKSRPQNTQYLFREGVTWGKVGSGITSFRWRPEGFGFNDAAPTLFGKSAYDLLAPLNSVVTRHLLTIRGGTLNVTGGVVSELPNLAQTPLVKRSRATSTQAIDLTTSDWDAYETSWDFTTLPLLRREYRRDTLAATFAALRDSWREMTDEMQRLEEENNRIFIDAYGLQDELTPDVPLAEITLTCNPQYRYNGDKTDDELEALLLADTMREFISYAVGCLFGRYSLDQPGLILANAGETVDDYLRRVANPTFPPDPDGVLPILDGDWFSDDIVDGFRRFLRATFGEAQYRENLAFIEDALGRDIRSYFLREFYDDHLKRYKKRPIYWLFSSPGGSFNALIYLHRYRRDTVSVVLNDYLRDFMAKLTAEKRRLEQLSVSPSASAREKSAALRELGKLEQTLAELQAYETEILFPLAAQRLAIDLDDGVKVNYAKLGPALKKVSGLTPN